MYNLNIQPVKSTQALLVSEGSERSLIISDLHIGWEISLIQEGFHFPTQMNKILERIFKLLDAYKPSRLIILGDVKHTVSGIELEEWRDIPAFFESLLEKIEDITVVPGNHDGNISVLTPHSVRIAPVKGITIGSEVGLFHGHSWPDPQLLGCTYLIMGHIHPVISIQDAAGFWIKRQVWVKVKCEGEKVASSLFRYLNISGVEDVKSFLLERFGVKLNLKYLIILPSFNEVLGGLPLNVRMRDDRETEAYIGPLLRSGSIDLQEADLYLLDGTFLGRIKDLQRLSKER